MTVQPYILPSTTVPLPGKLNLTQFLQTVLVGISGLPGTMVRPKWQIAPPKQPDVAVNWMGFGITRSMPDTYSYVGVNSSGQTVSQRQEGLEIGCSIYGPEGLDIETLIRDGFQIPQNLQALTAANMGFTEIGQALQVPDLINERWINRIEMSIFIRREIQRTYAIPTLISANGKIHSVIGNEEYLLDWATQS